MQDTDGAIRRAAEIGAYLEKVPYPRYERKQQQQQPRTTHA